MPVKNNLGPLGTGLAYTIESHDAFDAPVIRWESAAVTTTVEEAFRPAANSRGPEAEDRRNAGEWLEARARRRAARIVARPPRRPRERLRRTHAAAGAPRHRRPNQKERLPRRLVVEPRATQPPDDVRPDEPRPTKVSKPTPGQPKRPAAKNLSPSTKLVAFEKTRRNIDAIARPTESLADFAAARRASTTQSAPSNDSTAQPRRDAATQKRRRNAGNSPTTTEQLKTDANNSTVTNKKVPGAIPDSFGNRLLTLNSLA